MAKCRDHHCASLARGRHENAAGPAALRGKGKGSQQKGAGHVQEGRKKASRPGRDLRLAVRLVATRPVAWVAGLGLVLGHFELKFRPKGNGP